MATCSAAFLSTKCTPLLSQENKAKPTGRTRSGVVRVQAVKKADGKGVGGDEKPSRIQLKRPKRDLTSTMAAKEEQAGRVLNACLNAVGTMDLEAMDLCLQMANEIRDGDQREGSKK